MRVMGCGLCFAKSSNVGDLQQEECFSHRLGARIQDQGVGRSMLLPKPQGRVLPASSRFWGLPAALATSSGLLIGTPVLDSGPTLLRYDLILIDYTCKYLFPNKVTF